MHLTVRSQGVRCPVWPMGGTAGSCRVRVGGPPSKSPAGGDAEFKTGLEGTDSEPPPSPAQMAQLENWADSLQKLMPLEERKQFCGGSFLDFKSSRQHIIPSSKLYI